MIIDRNIPKKVRVLVVDDSAFYRHRISNMLSSDERIEIVGAAGDGQSAVKEALRLKPDVITMDIEMPVMDGISAVKKIMSQEPIPIVMLSTYTNEGAKATLDALNAGAVDFIPKPSGTSIEFSDKLSTMLIQRVLAMSKKKMTKTASSAVERLAEQMPRSIQQESPLEVKQGRYKLVVIGASTGGPVAIQKLLCSLPKDFKVPLVLVVHMPSTFTTAYAERLNSLCELNVKEAVDGDLLIPGHVLLAPGGKQLSFCNKGAEIIVSLRDGVHGETYKPSIDLTLGSASEVLRDSVLAVILTGMGSDGSQGASMLKQYDSTVWSQDEASCVVYGMPQAVEKNGLSDLVLPLVDIGPSLVKAV